MTVATPPPAMGSMNTDGSIDIIESETIKPGDVIDNKYQVVRVLGRGGMGLVLEAIHLRLQEPVALKFMNAETVANPEAAARFTREARAAARLKGEHICRVLDMGETVGGDRYIVIEYLEGMDLSQVLRRRGPLPYAEAVDYILQACEAMAEAHAAGIVHRDLKPANLFLTTGTDGEASIKVLDFGISKVLDADTASAMTTTRALMGSPLYMAPEQLVSAKDVDQRTDIWALATVLYRLVSGKTPFFGDSLPEVVAQVLHTDPPLLSSLVPDVPAGLDEALARALAKAPAERYATVAELAADLAAVLPQSSHRAVRSAAVLKRPRRPSTAQGTSPPPIAESSSLDVILETLDVIPADPLFVPEPNSSLELSAEPPRRRGGLRWVIPAVGGAAVAAVAFYVYQARAGDPAPTAPAPVAIEAPAPDPTPAPTPEPAPPPTELAGSDVDVEPEPEAEKSEKKKKRRRRSRAVNKDEPETSEVAETKKTKSSGELLEPGAVKIKKKPEPRPDPKPKKKSFTGPELLD